MSLNYFFNGNWCLMNLLIKNECFIKRRDFGRGLIIMIVYHIVFWLCAIGVFIELDKNNKKYVLFIYVLFAMIYICRARVGTDYSVYLKNYNLLGNSYISEITEYELGYELISHLFRLFHMPFQLMTMAMHSVVIICFYKATSKLKLDFAMTFFLSLFYIFFPTLETLRQEISIILFYYSLPYITAERGKYNNNTMVESKSTGRIASAFKYYITNIVGFLFHRTSILSAAYYPFHKKRTVRIVVVIFLLSFVEFEPYILRLMSKIPAFYNRYVFYKWQTSQHVNSGGIFSLKLLEYIIIIIVLLFIKNKTEIEKIAMSLAMLGVPLLIFANQTIDVVYRFIYYCDIGIVIFYSSIYSRIKKPIYKIIYIAIMTVYLLIRFSRTFQFDNPSFMYHFLF